VNEVVVRKIKDLQRACRLAPARVRRHERSVSFRRRRREVGRARGLLLVAERQRARLAEAREELLGLRELVCAHERCHGGREGEAVERDRALLHLLQDLQHLRRECRVVERESGRGGEVFVCV